MRLLFAKYNHFTSNLCVDKLRIDLKLNTNNIPTNNNCFTFLEMYGSNSIYIWYVRVYFGLQNRRHLRYIDKIV